MSDNVVSAGVSKLLETLGGSTSENQSGFLTWTVDNSQPEVSYTPVEIGYTTLFSPTTTSYTIPIITISGSTVEDTGNTSTAQPTTYTADQNATASPSVSQAASQGLDLTSIIVPLAIIAAVGVAGVTAINVFAGDGKTKKVKKAVTN